MPYAFAMPLLPGKAEAARSFVGEVLGPRKSDWDDLQRRQGVTHERYFLQSGPDGDLVIVTGEGTFSSPNQFLDPDQIPFDRWFLDQIQETTGVNLLELGDELPELLGEWQP